MVRHKLGSAYLEILNNTLAKMAEYVVHDSEEFRVHYNIGVGCLMGIDCGVTAEVYSKGSSCVLMLPKRDTCRYMLYSVDSEGIRHDIRIAGCAEAMSGLLDWYIAAGRAWNKLKMRYK